MHDSLRQNTSSPTTTLLWVMVDTCHSHDKYGPVYHSTHNHMPKTAAPQPGGVMRSAKLNPVESACGESPKTSPLTPYCPAHTQTKRLTHQPPPVPTFRCLWSGKKHSNYWLDIGDGSNSDKYYVACSCVGVVQHWRTSSSWLEGHLNSHITHTSEDWKKRVPEGGSFMNTLDADTLVCLCVVQNLKDTNEGIFQQVNYPQLW